LSFHLYFFLYPGPRKFDKVKAAVYKGDSKITVEDCPKPVILEPTDAIVKVITPPSAEQTCNPPRL
jgi:hypothetical protein